jgi:ribose transport system ATP-binding protein
LALRSADLQVRSGEIHGLLGENGAGKSTLIKILAGLYEADGGEIAFGSASTDVPRDGTGTRLAFIHQEPVAFPDLSVAENIAFLTGYPTTAQFVRWHRVTARARRILESMGVDIDVRAKMATLPIAGRTMVAIAAALANEATTVVLDEPTASLSAHEVKSLFAVLRELRSRGIAILLVTHRIDEVMAMCDRVTVLRDGLTVGRERIADITERKLVELIVGEDIASHSSWAQPTGAVDATEADRLLSVSGLRAEGLPGPITFSLRPGEILGFTGSLEAGHHTLGEVLVGLRRAVDGTLELHGERYAPTGPRGALARGVRYLPPDRNVLGLAPHLSLQENLFMNGAERAGRFFVGGRAERLAAQAELARFDVRPPNPRAEASTLSGGNAQKLLLTRCFLGEPRLVVLTEPTAGVDIGARVAIYDLLRHQAEGGVGVIVISSDFPEIHELCDRCIVLRSGRVAAELDGQAASVPAITRAAL